ncbi:hypothetical protein GCM10009661_59660 [Catellatospora chokoriensis]|uniref:Uncharacterized protein n=1 Tax=Catellatospora chokoriensis TaxID=310353 RepID=A0A8J3JWX9_9ACTN|nr:hypothetical protein Cch02nite_60860 [Catellatospora chokoriensis]
MINGWGQGIWMVSGSTDDLAEVIKAAVAWRDGVPLSEIGHVAPFVKVTQRGAAAEKGPEHVVAGEWAGLLQHAETAGWPEFRALVMAAHAEPKLRQLYPYTSHWLLGFSTTTGYPFSPTMVCLAVSSESRYGAYGPGRSVLGEAATAEEAVRIAANHLPADLGPAVAGPYPEDA